MPRFFFHVRDGETFPDEEGTELADLATVRLSAVQSFAQTMIDNVDELWSSGALSMRVTDGAGATLATLELIVRQGDQD